MTILIFTEGTILMHKKGINISREERVRQSKLAGIEREETSVIFDSKFQKSAPGSVHDYTSYVPIDNAVGKIKSWKNLGTTIYYMTSRRAKDDIQAISNVLKKYNFPDYKNLLFRKTNENYKEIVEKLMPDIFIEDDCESIGGAKEMTSTYLSKESKSKIQIFTVQEFGGINHLPFFFKSTPA